MVHLAPRVDNAFHLINPSPVVNAIDFPNTYPLDIVIYPLDSAIQRLNNRGQDGKTVFHFYRL